MLLYQVMHTLLGGSVSDHTASQLPPRAASTAFQARALPLTHSWLPSALQALSSFRIYCLGQTLRHQWSGMHDSSVSDVPHCWGSSFQLPGICLAVLYPFLDSELMTPLPQFSPLLTSMPGLTVSCWPLNQTGLDLPAIWRHTLTVWRISSQCLVWIRQILADLAVTSVLRLKKLTEP